jgi:hypothetical protein
MSSAIFSYSIPTQLLPQTLISPQKFPSVDLLVSSLILYPQTVFGDGLFQEQLSASFRDRKADLIIKMMPPVVTTETLKNPNQKPVTQFKLYDPSTKEGYRHVTYYITIEKDGKGI